MIGTRRSPVLLMVLGILCVTSTPLAQNATWEIFLRHLVFFRDAGLSGPTFTFDDLKDGDCLDQGLGCVGLKGVAFSSGLPVTSEYHPIEVRGNIQAFSRPNALNPARSGQNAMRFPGHPVRHRNLAGGHGVGA